MAEVIGAKELMRKLQGLEKKEAKKAVNKAMSKAVRPVIQSARAAVRPVSKTVAKSLGIRRKRYQGGSVQIAVVGPRVGDNVVSTKTVTNPFTGETSVRKHLPWLTAHLIEGGVAPHETHIPWLNLKAQHPGVPAKPFLGPALEKNENKSIQIFGQVIQVEVERYART